MRTLEKIKPCNDCLKKEEENKILECKLDELEISDKQLEVIMEELEEDEAAPPNSPVHSSEEEGSLETDITASDWFNIFKTSA